MSQPRSDLRPCPEGDGARLQAYLDGELPAPAQAAIAAHLERCARCTAAAQRLTELDRLLGAARPQPPALSPAAAHALLDRALAEAGVRRGGRGRGLMLLVWGCAAVLVVTAGMAGGWWRSAPVTRALGAGPHGMQVAGLPVGPHPLAPAPKHWGRGNDLGSPRVAPYLGVRRQSGGEGQGRRSPLLRSLEERTASATLLPPRSWRRRRVRREHRLAEARRHGGAAAAGQAPDGIGPVGQRLRDREPGALMADLPPDGGLSSPVPPASSSLPIDPRAWCSPAEAEMTSAASAAPAPRLLVLVTSEPAPSPLAVREAPEEAPSYARAVALRPDANGGSTWTQATASSNGSETKLALVMLGSGPWDWGEEE